MISLQRFKSISITLTPPTDLSVL